MSPGHDPYAVLRLPDFRRLLLGNLLASVGSEMMHVAVGWELYERTASAAALGYVGLVQFVPVLLLFLAAGHAADRYSRRWIYAAAQGLMASAAIGLAALSLLQGPVYLVYVCLAVIGVSRAFSAPSRASLVPLLVPGELLSNAVAWNTSGWQIATVAGPALGGPVIAVTNQPAVAYALTAGCACGCAALVTSLRPPPQVRRGEPVTLQSLLAGFRFVWRTRLLLATLTLDLFAVLLGGATALLPIFARDILQVGASGLGWLRAAPSLGALAMAFVLTHSPPLHRAGRALLWSVAGFGLATIVFGLSGSAWLTFAMLAVTGALDNVSVVVRHTLVQKLTPDAMRGRVSAVNLIFISSSNELGAFESGITAEWFGPVVSVVGGGIGTVLVVLLVTAVWPQVRRLGPLHEVRQAEMPS
jgi:MFS family permease